MTLVGCMSKMDQYPGVSLSVIAWLETRDVLLFIGHHTLQVGAEEKPPT